MSLLDETTELLLQAHIDGELDAASVLAFDRRLAREPALAEARDRLLALRGVLRGVPRERASERLRAAIAAHGEGAPRSIIRFAPKATTRESLKRSVLSEWRMGMAACLVGVLFGAGLTTALLSPRAQAPVMAEVVADHLRAVMAPQPFDVASSDQHTVKPWFTGRLPFAPQVFDLSPEGFALIGGRVDVLGGQPAASLVFRHDKHLISLTSQPVASALPGGGQGSAKGFLVRDWVAGGMHYWAVSDIAPEELDVFEAAARAHLAGAG